MLGGDQRGRQATAAGTDDGDVCIVKHQFKKLPHSIYEGKYLIVFCPKYRYHIFKDGGAGYTKYQMLVHKNLQYFSTIPDEIDSRLRARLTLWELFSLGFAFCMIGIFVWVHYHSGSVPFDYSVYIKTAHGDLVEYYYADWALPLFWPLAKLPFLVGYFIWGIAGVLCVFFAARVFGGNVALVLLAYQMLYVLFFGQIAGILVGGLALAWWAMAQRRWNVAGVGFLIACIKFQIGMTFGLLLWLAADITWRQRLRVLLLPTVIVIMSLVIYPLWPLNLLARIQYYPPNELGSISFWRWFGPIALLFWIPPLLLSLPPKNRLLALAATWTLTLPYFQQTDLLSLFVLPVGWLPVLLGNLGYLYFKYQSGVFQLLVIVPLLIYASIIAPALYKLIRNQFSPVDTTSLR